MSPRAPRTARTPGTGTDWWMPGPLIDQAGLLGVRIGAWNHFHQPGKAPAPGSRSAEAVEAGHGAVSVIDEILRDLNALRARLLGELRRDAGERRRLADRVIAQSRPQRPAARQGGAR